MHKAILYCLHKPQVVERLASNRPLTTSLGRRQYSAQNQDIKDSDLNIGDTIHGYKLEKSEYIEELNIRPYLLRHLKTGSEHLHVSKPDDANNVFAVSLRTTPKNSTGVAHILEHLALCGSKKYGVRDPFFKMLTRSLATFMNAMTGPDFTVYPFATQNRKDFENLLRIYTDAVFFPRLRPVDFRQEGWRIEHETPNDKDTKLVLKGVVYNEMKGAFSSSAAIYARKLLNELFPDTTYRHESGGDPNNIPDLSHAELKKFHSNHYHPSNSKFYTYGNIPLVDHLKLLDELVMSHFNENAQAREHSVVHEQTPWKEPRKVELTCPNDPMTIDPKKQVTTSLSYMLPLTNTSFDDMFALQMLSVLLIDGPTAPFYKSLIESGLGSEYSPSTGLGNYTKQPYFSVGLQNIKAEDIDRVHEIIAQTFAKTAETGFPDERIEAVLHEIELGLKHISGNFGLRIAMNIESVWNHDGDPVEYMKINGQILRFKDNLRRDDKFWAKLIEKYFIKNTHKLILNMRPDPSFEDKRKDAEQQLLENKIAKLTDVDRQTVLYEGMELMKIQNSKDDLSVLPCLDPSKDISRDLVNKTELKFDSHKGIKLQLCEQPTNEVVYFRALADIGEQLSTRPDLIDYLPIFSDVAMKLGAGRYDRLALAQRMQLKTGGLNLSFMINPSLTESDEFKRHMFLGAHCLTKNVEDMFELWMNLFESIHFNQNKEHLVQLIKASASELSDSIPFHGQAYAMKRAASVLTEANQLEERLGGLTYVARVKDIASKEPIDSVTAKLLELAKIVFDPYGYNCAINAEPQSMQSVVDQCKRFIDTTQKLSGDRSPHPAVTTTNTAQTSVEDVKFPFDTHFVAKSLKSVPKAHEDYAPLVIMSKLISSKYLHREVREKGGAYGSRLLVSGNGVLNFFSYRDPNTTKTLETFDGAYDWIIDGEGYTDQDVEESKLGVFQDIDRPVEPGRRGVNYFLLGETDEMREQYRRRLLDVSREDVVRVAERYLRQEKFGTAII